jgi:polysaccharide export outer membrane protein
MRQVPDSAAKYKILALALLCAFLFVSATVLGQTPVPVSQSSNQSGATADTGTSQQSNNAGKPEANSSSRTLRIGGGDLLEIKVFGVPELTDSVRVSGRGDVSLPLIGTIHLDGLTSEQSEKLIEQKLKDGGFLRDPHVSIFVKEYVTQGISVMGEVSRPGVYPLLGARRLFDALSSAGGTTPKAGKIVSNHSP